MYTYVCACECVRVRKPCVCPDWFIMFATKMNFLKKRTKKKRREFTDRADRFLFLRSRHKSSRCRCLSTMKYSVRLSFRHDILMILPPPQPPPPLMLLLLLPTMLVFVVVAVVATCVRECYVMKCVAVVNMTCACFSKR